MKQKFTVYRIQFAVASVFVFYSSFAQDIHFSQFYMTPLVMNPANAGIETREIRGILNYKDQWRSVASPYKTMGASCDMRIQKKRRANGFWGTGINFLNDKAGHIEMKFTQVNLAAAYHVYLNRQKYSTIGGGLQTGFVQRSINYAGEGVTWGSQYDGNSYNPNLPTGEPGGSTSYTYADYLSAGVLWHYNNLSGMLRVKDDKELRATLGLSVYHITRPKYSFYQSGEKLYMKYVLYGNSLISIPNSNISFAPGFLFFRQGPAQEIYPGTLIRYRLQQASKYTGYFKGTAVSLGGYLRVKDAVAATIILEHSGYALGVSYDINTSDLKVASSGRGGIEISLKIQSANPFVPSIYGSRSKF